jgi:hypothetical protein
MGHLCLVTGTRDVIRAVERIAVTEDPQVRKGACEVLAERGDFYGKRQVDKPFEESLRSACGFILKEH